MYVEVVAVDFISLFSWIYAPTAKFKNCEKFV